MIQLALSKLSQLFVLAALRRVLHWTQAISDYVMASFKMVGSKTAPQRPQHTRKVLSVPFAAWLYIGAFCDLQAAISSRRNVELPTSRRGRLCAAARRCGLPEYLSFRLPTRKPCAERQGSEDTPLLLQETLCHLPLRRVWYPQVVSLYWHGQWDSGHSFGRYHSTIKAQQLPDWLRNFY